MLFKRGVVLLICIIMAFGMYTPAVAATGDTVRLTTFIDLQHPSISIGIIHGTVNMREDTPVLLKDVLPLTYVYASGLYDLQGVDIVGLGSTSDGSYSRADIDGGQNCTYETSSPSAGGGSAITVHYEYVGPAPSNSSKGGGGNVKHIPVPIGLIGIDWEKDFAAGKTYKFSTLPESARLDFAAGDLEKRGHGEGFMHADEDGYFYIKPLKTGKIKLKFSSNGFIDREITINVK